jgi:hypothetical protein
MEDALFAATGYTASVFGATTPQDIEPLRKRIQGAVNRQRSGLQPVPPRQQKQRKHTSTGIFSFLISLL